MTYQWPGLRWSLIDALELFYPSLNTSSIVVLSAQDQARGFQPYIFVKCKVLHHMEIGGQGQVWVDKKWFGPALAILILDPYLMHRPGLAQDL